jgi:hypothetical protein
MFRKSVIKNSRGEILVENVIFIVLNLVFLTILALFLVNQSSGVLLLERPYAKQIALLADSARPGMMMEINMAPAMKLAEKNKISFEDAIKIEDNSVIVKLSPNSGQEYTFFNDLKIHAYPNRTIDNEYTGNYILNFEKKSNGEVVNEI